MEVGEIRMLSPVGLATNVQQLLLDLVVGGQWQEPGSG